MSEGRGRQGGDTGRGREEETEKDREEGGDRVVGGGNWKEEQGEMGHMGDRGRQGDREEDGKAERRAREGKKKEGAATQVTAQRQGGDRTQQGHGPAGRGRARARRPGCQVSPAPGWHVFGVSLFCKRLDSGCSGDLPQR